MSFLDQTGADAAGGAGAGASMALGPIGAAISAVGALMSGITTSVSDGRKATALDHQALQASEEAGINAGERLTQGDAVAAQGAVRAAANGGGLTGSSMGVIASLSQAAMFNARNAIYRGNVERSNDLYAASMTRSAGHLALISGLFGGGASLTGAMLQGAQQSAQDQAMTALRGDSGYGYGGGY